jgi:hypothetical protein
MFHIVPFLSGNIAYYPGNIKALVIDDFSNSWSISQNPVGFGKCS